MCRRTIRGGALRCSMPILNLALLSAVLHNFFVADPSVPSLPPSAPLVLVILLLGVAAVSAWRAWHYIVDLQWV